MRPLIGITADAEERVLTLKLDYVSAVVRAGGTPLILAHDPCDIPRTAEFLDGLLIPGGGDLLPQYYNEEVEVPVRCLAFTDKKRTDFELALLHEINRKKKPVLGICYGMQLINVMLGGNLYQDINLQMKGAAGHKDVTHDITIAGGFPQGFDCMTMPVGSNHHQAVRETGAGLEIFAKAEDGIIEGIYLPDHPFLAGVQWHAERGCDTLSIKIFELFVEKAKENHREHRDSPL